MIILGAILVFAAWALPQIIPDIPPGIDNVVYVGGWILILVGVLLWVLSFLGVAVGRGIGAGPRGRRYWW